MLDGTDNQHKWQLPFIDDRWGPGSSREDSPPQFGSGVNHLGNRLLKAGQPFLDVRFRDHQRRSETHHVGPCDQRHQPLIDGGQQEIAGASLVVFVQHGAQQQALTTHFAKATVLGIDGFEAVSEQLFALLDTAQHFRGVDYVEHCLGDGAGQRVAAVGRAVSAHFQVGGDLGGGQHGADGEAAAKGLGAGQDVRRHAQAHIGVELTGTTDTGLHLIVNQQCIVLVAQLAHPFGKFVGGTNDATLTLQRLHHHGAGIVGDDGCQLFQIVVGHMGDVGRLGTETVGVGGLATHAHGKEGTTVETLMEGDDLGLVGTKLLDGVTTGQLEGRLVGLGTGVAEVDLVGKRGGDQLLGQTQGRLVGHHVGEMPQLLALGFQGVDQLGMTMTQAIDRDTAGKVDIFTAFLIPDTRPLTTHRDDLGRRIVGNHHFIKHFTCHCQQLWHIALLRTGSRIIHRPKVKSV